jgi:oligopeptidase B
MTSDWSWLRADDWRACVADPALLPARIRAHLEAENNGCKAWFAQRAVQLKTLEGELRGRIEPHEDSLPELDGPWAYFTRYREGDDYGQYLRRPREGGDETVILDVEQEAVGYEYFDEGDVEHSPDHRYLAWARDTTGDERYTLCIRDLHTGEDVLIIDDVFEVTWGNADTVFFTRVNDELRASRVMRLTLGQEPVLIFEEQDPRFSVSVGTSRSGDYVMIDSEMTDCNEVMIIRADTIDAAPRVVEARTAGLEYWLEHQQDRFVILTNADGAADYKLVQAPLDSPARTHWRELEPCKHGRPLLDVSALGDWLIILERENALPRIRLTHRDGRERVLHFDEAAYALGIDAGLECDAERFRISYSSPTTPGCIFEEVLETGQRLQVKQQVIPSGHDPANYRTERIWVDSHDGVSVPVTVLYHRNTRLDGTAAALVYGYGAYGSSTPAEFSSSVLSLVDRGMVYAIAHVRGGQELGRDWYESGRLEYKMNSFEDLYAVAQHLVQQKRAAKGRVVLQGASAGGLLVAATCDLAVRRDPGLIAGVVADVPFVDVLSTMSDAQLPLTPSEWSEWGNPVEDAATRAYLSDYSPVDRVGHYAYPAIYVTAGISDPRVTWWEPARWVARLRECRCNDAPLLLGTNMESGHFGDTGRYGELAETARELAFILASAGIPVTADEREQTPVNLTPDTTPDTTQRTNKNTPASVGAS